MSGIERLRKLSQDYKNVSDAQKYIGINVRREADLLADIADQIERETQPKRGHAEDVSTSAYDLLPEEEREAIAWVREHGGLAHVKDIHHDFRAVVERLGVEWSESELHGLMDVLDRRLMPGGMEWLRFEDEEMVLLGSVMADELGEAHEVTSIEFFEDGVAIRWNPSEPEEFVWLKPGERVKRPATKVLDADGAEIRVVDKVWGTNGGAYRVTSAHDGKVFALHIGGSFGAEVESAGGEGLYRLRADQLTHERPDSWERLEEDIGAMVVAWRANKDLFDAQEAAAGCVGENTLGAALDSLARRVKALAGGA